ncbi:hypothetical protein KY290_037084 [Solanum tuberosum]|uniref:Uncharacterized protein n=1 Tax=Solanum tuberosum TaxID=4113 RepID=A0ABQ7TWE7_SOLTU|nr:hypothetical protein KY290_037084 [Solanum tuberosum]
MAQGNTMKRTHTLRAKEGITEEGATLSKNGEGAKPSNKAGKVKVTNESNNLKLMRVTVCSELQNSIEAQPTPEMVKSNMEMGNHTDARQLRAEWSEIRSSTSKMSWADEVEAMPDRTKKLSI